MDLIELLPGRLLNSKEVLDFENAINSIMIMAENEKDELLKQFNLETATWSLDIWEKQYGIKTDITKDYDLRRSRIKSKMRGTGTTTVEMIKNVAESFVNGLVEIVEHNEQYKFDIKMMSVIGIPPNMEDLKDAIEALKPAHLAYEIILKFNTHEMIRSFTYNYLKEKTYIGIREEDLYILTET